MQKFILATLCVAGLSVWNYSAADAEKPEPDQLSPLPKELMDETGFATDWPARPRPIRIEPG